MNLFDPAKGKRADGEFNKIPKRKRRRLNISPLHQFSRGKTSQIPNIGRKSKPLSEQLDLTNPESRLSKKWVDHESPDDKSPSETLHDLTTGEIIEALKEMGLDVADFAPDFAKGLVESIATVGGAILGGPKGAIAGFSIGASGVGLMSLIQQQVAFKRGISPNPPDIKRAAQEGILTSLIGTGMREIIRAGRGMISKKEATDSVAQKALKTTGSKDLKYVHGRDSVRSSLNELDKYLNEYPRRMLKDSQKRGKNIYLTNEKAGDVKKLFKDALQEIDRIPQDSKFVENNLFKNDVQLLQRMAQSKRVSLSDISHGISYLSKLSQNPKYQQGFTGDFFSIINKLHDDMVNVASSRGNFKTIAEKRLPTVKKAREIDLSSILNYRNATKASKDIRKNIDLDNTINYMDEGIEGQGKGVVNIINRVPIQDEPTYNSVFNTARRMEGGGVQIERGLLGRAKAKANVTDPDLESVYKKEALDTSSLLFGEKGSTYIDIGRATGGMPRSLDFTKGLSKRMSKLAKDTGELYQVSKYAKEPEAKQLNDAIRINAAKLKKKTFKDYKRFKEGVAYSGLILGDVKTLLGIRFLGGLAEDASHKRLINTILKPLEKAEKGPSYGMTRALSPASKAQLVNVIMDEPEDQDFAETYSLPADEAEENKSFIEGLKYRKDLGLDDEPEAPSEDDLYQEGLKYRQEMEGAPEPDSSQMMTPAPLPDTQNMSFGVPEQSPRAREEGYAPAVVGNPPQTTDQDVTQESSSPTTDDFKDDKKTKQSYASSIIEGWSKERRG